MPAPSISGVDFVTIPTNDIEASKRFYGDVLGLPFVKQWGELPGFEYQAGDLTIAVMDPTAFGQEFQPNAGMIAFAVDDVEAAREALKAEGVEFLNEMIDSGVCHQAIFRDPSGNTLDLHHRYRAGAPPS